MGALPMSEWLHHWLEPLTVLAVVAGRTERIRLGTYILIAALRRPAVLAKQLATLDVLSGGRVDLGVGVGWQREEYEACGLDYDGRGRLLDHTLEVCEVLWTEQRVDYASPELEFAAIHQMPKPVQPGGVPLWVSGTVNPRAMRRLADFGSGWIPWGPDAADLTVGIPKMRDAVAGFDRDPAGIGVVGTLPIVRTDTDPSGNAVIDLDATMAGVPALADAGVTDFRAHLPIPSGLDAATEYLSDVVARFEAVTT